MAGSSGAAPLLESLHLPSVDLTDGGASVLPTATGSVAAGDDTTITLTLDGSLVYPTYIGHGAIFTSTTNTLALSETMPGSSDTESFAGSLYLARTTKAGYYTVTSAVITDAAGHSTTYSTADLAADGFDTVLTVRNDTTPPALTSLVLPFSANGGDTPADAISIGATETGSDTPYLYAVVNLDHAIAAEQGSGVYVNMDAAGLLQGGPASSMESGTVGSVAVHAPAGVSATYNVTSVVLIDYAGNEADYSADQLHAMGFATSFRLPQNTAADFDGNYQSDILWRNTDGALSTWSAGPFGDPTFVQNTSYASAATTWHITDSFDWNGDGKADIVWRNDSGALSIWAGNRSGFEQSAYYDTSVSPDWSVVGAGDLNGDGKDDLLWRNLDGSISTWLSTGTGFQQNAYFHASPGTDWKVEGVGDFNGDGRADILWRNDDGAVSTWDATVAGFQEDSTFDGPVDRTWHVVGIGDFDGDGKADILWRNDDGEMTVWRSTGTGFEQGQLNAAASTDWTVAQVGDFNGDGRADILWRDTSGAISIWQSNGSGWAENTYFDGSVGNDWAISSHAFPL